MLPVRYSLPLLIAVNLLGGCGGPSQVVSTTPQKMTLYSIDPMSIYDDKKVEQREKFHGYAVLGKVEITDAVKRTELAAALNESISKRGVNQYKCFEPRHGVIAIDGDETKEFVICFECRNVQIYGKGSHENTVPISDERRAAFDKPLTDAGIKLAPQVIGKR